ncbi:MAG TPA: OmpW family outer membrane protein [Aquabacterium sp.]|uniref:OmpW/AlkL family protein n=1 Tax=Aquabacterium sp. TaxID=1872578 RepID=UPI002E353271|nr:OmpW family outer membrane protein [Aquabacterium sp.]HEX5373398.1 OmpW family outer membrane protein [Aquabacterium sp.]
MNKPLTGLAAAALLTLSTLAAAPAMAQSAEGPWLVRVRAVNIDPANKDDISVTDVSVNSKVIPEVDISYFFTPNIAAELILTYPQKHDVSSSAHGGKIGTLKHLPPTLTAQYHFIPDGKFRPYVGAGINYTHFSNVDLPSPFSIDKDSFGLALQAGIDIEIGKNLFLNLDIKKVQIRTDLKAAGEKLGTIKVDPVLVGVGIGWRF